MIPAKQLLFMEPVQPASSTPVLDSATRKICAAFRKAKKSDYAYGGIHECVCGATSSSCDYHLPSGDLTNSLCVHYLAHHRAEVDKEELARVESFSFGEADPSEEELQGPAYLFASIRANIDRRLGPDRLHTWIGWGLDITALAQALRGGFLSHTATHSQTRRDAHDLYNLIHSLPSEVLPCVQAAAVRSHGDVAAWAAEALRVSGWNRAAWMLPLAEILGLPESVLREKRLIAMLEAKLKRDLEEDNES